MLSLGLWIPGSDRRKTGQMLILSKSHTILYTAMLIDDGWTIDC